MGAIIRKVTDERGICHSNLMLWNSYRSDILLLETALIDGKVGTKMSFMGGAHGPFSLAFIHRLWVLPFTQLYKYDELNEIKDLQYHEQFYSVKSVCKINVCFLRESNIFKNIVNFEILLQSSCLWRDKTNISVTNQTFYSGYGETLTFQLTEFFFQLSVNSVNNFVTSL